MYRGLCADDINCSFAERQELYQKNSSIAQNSRTVQQELYEGVNQKNSSIAQDHIRRTLTE